MEKQKGNKKKDLFPRRGGSTVLSTKTLSPSQRSLLVGAGLLFMEYDAITTQHIDFKFPKNTFDALVFTSQNGVRSYLERMGKLAPPVGVGPWAGETFCVGEKTRGLLEENGFQVTRTAPNAEQLGIGISTEHKNLSFLLLVGNHRREELPILLKRHQVKFEEVIVYKTFCHPKQFQLHFDGALFFSPSGAGSFFQENILTGTAFCIGETTAKEVRKYTENYSIADQPTVENVIIDAIRKLSFRA